jgi:hypothetical protein
MTDGHPDSIGLTQSLGFGPRYYRTFLTYQQPPYGYIS